MQLKTKNGNIKSSDRNLPISYRMVWPKNLEYPAPAVVFVPGFGSSLQTSDYIQKSLKHIAQSGAIAIGFNYSNIKVKKNMEVDTAKLTCENADEDLRRVLDFARNNEMVDVQKIVGMGCSFGGHTLFRSDDKDLAAYLAFSLVPDFGKPFKDKLTETKLRIWRMSQKYFNRGTKQMIDGSMQEINFYLYDQACKVDLREKISSIKQPITLIHGTNDILASVDDIQDLQQYMANSVDAKVHFINGAGHKFNDNVQHGMDTSELGQAIALAKTQFTRLFSKNGSQIMDPANDNRIIQSPHLMVGNEDIKFA